MNKKCTKCGETKSIDLYAKNKSKPNREAQCKECKSKYDASIRTDFSRVVQKTYSNQKRSSARRGHEMGYSLKELYQWCRESKEFNHHLQEWIKRGGKARCGSKPSIDRIDNNLGYSLRNIRACSWSENNKLGREHRMSPVINLDDLTEFESATAASKHLNISRTGIINAIKRGGKCAGIRWGYKKNYKQ